MKTPLPQQVGDQISRAKPKPTTNTTTAHTRNSQAAAHPCLTFPPLRQQLDCEVNMSDLKPDNQPGSAKPPISFKVIGVDRQTGNDVETVVTARSEANARVKAE